MKLQDKNRIREKFLVEIMSYYNEEDVEKITSNSFNMPLVDSETEEEFWLEIIVKLPNYNDDEGFAKREEYQLKLKAKAEKEKAKAQKLEKQKKGK